MYFSVTLTDTLRKTEILNQILFKKLYVQGTYYTKFA